MLTAAVDQATDGQLAGLVSAVGAGEMWADFDQLVDGLNHPGRDRLITVVGDVPADAFSRLQATGRTGRLGAETTRLLVAAASLR